MTFKYLSSEYRKILTLVLAFENRGELLPYIDAGVVLDFEIVSADLGHAVCNGLEHRQISGIELEDRFRAFDGLLGKLGLLPTRE